MAITTCADAGAAETLAELLVSERLAACVNILPGARSIYRWDGDVSRESEVMMLIKTTEDRWAAMSTRLCAAHPYDVPELIGWPIERGAPDYLDWVNASVAQPGL